MCLRTKAYFVRFKGISYSDVVWGWNLQLRWGLRNKTLLRWGFRDKNLHRWGLRSTFLLRWDLRHKFLLRWGLRDKNLLRWGVRENKLTPMDFEQKTYSDGLWGENTYSEGYVIVVSMATSSIFNKSFSRWRIPIVKSSHCISGSLPFRNSTLVSVGKLHYSVTNEKENVRKTLHVYYYRHYIRNQYAM